MENKDQTNVIGVKKCHESAVTPTKAHPSDIGYDLTAVDVFKTLNDQTTLFETHLVVVPPEGYYLEILPRSSLSKTGYVLANSVGTIDPSYRGTLKIALTKVVPTVNDIELPFTRCQLVLRKAECSDIIEVDDVNETVRGSGGFGSTDK